MLGILHLRDSRLNHKNGHSLYTYSVTDNCKDFTFNMYCLSNGEVFGIWPNPYLSGTKPFSNISFIYLFLSSVTNLKVFLGYVLLVYYPCTIKLTRRAIIVLQFQKS